MSIDATEVNPHDTITNQQKDQATQGHEPKPHVTKEIALSHEAPHDKAKEAADDHPEAETTKRDRQFYLASPDHFVLNPGHTDSPELNALSLTLVGEGVADFVDDNGKTYIAIDVDQLPNYLARHHEDQPHAIAEITTLISEELKQFVNPKRSIEDMRDVAEQLESDADDEDLTEDLKFLEGDLQTTLSTVPGQQLAVCGFLTNSDVQSFFKTYIDTYKDQQRTYKKILNDEEVDIKTSQTYGEYLSGVLDNIKTSLRNQNSQILSCLEELNFLQQHGLPLPQVQQLQEITI